MDPMQTLVTHFRAARYEDLAPEVVATVKITVLDTLGAALAGSASEAGRGIARVARRYGCTSGAITTRPRSWASSASATRSPV